MPTSIEALAVELQIEPPLEPVQANQWFPLLLILRIPEDGEAVEIINVECKNKAIEFDKESFKQGVVVRPGETYRLTLRSRLPHSQTINLGDFFVELKEDEDNLYDFPPQTLFIAPPIREEIEISVDPICTYTNATKVLVTFSHIGEHSFEDLVVTLGPEKCVNSGKSLIRVPCFGRGDQEKVELVIEGDSLEISMSCVVDGTAIHDRLAKAIDPLLRSRSRKFQFLAPRRLSSDTITIWRRTDKPDQTIDKVGPTFPVNAGESYKIKIEPKGGAVDVKVRDIPGIAHVPREPEKANGSWIFDVDVTSAGRVFTQPKQLYYEVTRSDEKTTGEVHLKLQPGKLKHLLFATTLGLAITIQGIVVLARYLLRYTEEVGFQVFFLPSILLLWLIIWCIDTIQYRVKF